MPKNTKLHQTKPNHTVQEAVNIKIIINKLHQSQTWPGAAYWVPPPPAPAVPLLLINTLGDVLFKFISI